MNLAEKTGKTINTIPPVLKDAWDVGTVLVSGPLGIVKAVFTEMSGLGEQLEEGKEYVTVRIDAALRDDPFAQVYAENQNKSVDNRTHNETTGFDFFLSALSGGLLGKGIPKGKGGPGAKADAPAATHGGVPTGGNPGSAKGGPDKAGEIDADSPSAPKGGAPDDP